MQAATAAVLAVVAATTAVGTFGSPERAFLTVVAATLAVTVLSGAIFLVLGMLRRGNLIRFVPYPVVGGFLAGAGWLLLKGGIYVASGESPSQTPIWDLTDSSVLQLWLPALAFGLILLIATRLVKRPLVIPAVLGIGLVLFVIGMLVTGSSIESARGGNWLLLTVFDEAQPWEPWTLRAVTGADWLAVLEQWAGIAAAVFVAVVVILFNISETELVLHRDLDTNQELRDAGVLNVVSGRRRRDPRVPRAQHERARRRHEGQRAPGGAHRRARPARRGRVRRVRHRADPAHDRRRRAGVPRPRLPGRVGVGPAAVPAARRVTGSSS